MGERCDSWCEGHAQSWLEKCSRFALCSDCQQCKLPPLMPPNPMLPPLPPPPMPPPPPPLPAAPPPLPPDEYYHSNEHGCYYGGQCDQHVSATYGNIGYVGHNVFWLAVNVQYWWAPAQQMVVIWSGEGTVDINKVDVKAGCTVKEFKNHKITLVGAGSKGCSLSFQTSHRIPPNMTKVLCEPVKMLKCGTAKAAPHKWTSSPLVPPLPTPKTVSPPPPEQPSEPPWRVPVAPPSAQLPPTMSPSNQHSVQPGISSLVAGPSIRSPSPPLSAAPESALVSQSVATTKGCGALPHFLLALVILLSLLYLRKRFLCCTYEINSSIVQWLRSNSIIAVAGSSDKKRPAPPSELRQGRQVVPTSDSEDDMEAFSLPLSDTRSTLGSNWGHEYQVDACKSASIKSGHIGPTSVCLQAAPKATLPTRDADGWTAEEREANASAIARRMAEWDDCDIVTSRSSAQCIKHGSLDSVPMPVPLIAPPPPVGHDADAWTAKERAAKAAAFHQRATEWDDSDHTPRLHPLPSRHESKPARPVFVNAPAPTRTARGVPSLASTASAADASGWSAGEKAAQATAFRQRMNEMDD